MPYYRTSASLTVIFEAENERDAEDQMLQYLARNYNEPYFEVWEVTQETACAEDFSYCIEEES